MRAAVGFRPHSGWACAVAVTATRDVVDRARVDLSAPGVPVQPFHAAAGMDLAAAAALVDHVHAVAAAAAATGLDEIAASLDAAGHELVAVGLPVGNLAIPADLETILRAHPLLHAAEGDLFRQVIAEAAQARGLSVVEVLARDMAGQARRMLGLDDAALLSVLKDAGWRLGPPWRRDEKEATMLGWLALDPPAIPPPGR
jgi:hypothetical protein